MIVNIRNKQKCIKKILLQVGAKQKRAYIPNIQHNKDTKNNNNNK